MEPNAAVIDVNTRKVLGPVRSRRMKVYETRTTKTETRDNDPPALSRAAKSWSWPLREIESCIVTLGYQ
jgi:hypothetical protein